MRLIFLLGCLLGFSLPGQATSFTGGKISYRLKSDSTYILDVALYSSCDSAVAVLPTSFKLCAFNSCGSFTDTVLLQQVPAGQFPQPNFKQYLYSGTYTLPARCISWTFYVSVANRQTTNNLQTAVSNLYLEATLNNTGVLPVYSPDIMLPPLAVALAGKAVSYMPGINGFGDSISIDLLQPRSAPENFYTASNCAANSAAIVPYTSGFSVAAPFAMSSAIMINPSQDTLFFTPSGTAVGSNALAIRVTKYINGVKVGSMTREEMVRVVNPLKSTAGIQNMQGINFASILPPQGDTVLRATAIAYANQPFSFEVAAVQPISSPFASILLTSDHSFSLPGSSHTVTSASANTATGNLSFSPILSDTGSYHVLFTLNDTVTTLCSSPAYISHKQYAIVHLTIAGTNSVRQIGRKDIHILRDPHSLSVQSTRPVVVSLRSIEGRVLSHGAGNQPIDVSMLSSGIYLIHVADEHGQTLMAEKLVQP